VLDCVPRLDAVFGSELVGASLDNVTGSDECRALGALDAVGDIPGAVATADHPEGCLCHVPAYRTADNWGSIPPVFRRFPRRWSGTRSGWTLSGQSEPPVGRGYRSTAELIS